MIRLSTLQTNLSNVIKMNENGACFMYAPAKHYHMHIVIVTGPPSGFINTMNMNH